MEPVRLSYKFRRRLAIWRLFSSFDTSSLNRQVSQDLQFKPIDKMQIKLQAGDNGEVFPVDIEVAKMSATIKTMMEDLGIEDSQEDVVALPNVDGPVLKMVIEWATHHKDDPQPAEDNESKSRFHLDIPEWDKKFLKVPQAVLYDLIVAADCLDIKGLLDVTCKTVATWIKGKSPEEIRKILNVKKDLDAEQ